MDHEQKPPFGQPDRTLDQGALRALAHPLRVQMYDILSQYGPQTASSLAQLTGESSGSTSYHLRALAKHDLIREVEGRGSGRERWWERPKGSISFTNPEAMRTPSGRAATQVIMSEFLNRRHQQLLRFVGESMKAPDSLDGAPEMISTSTLRLTDEQANLVSDRLQAVMNEASAAYRDQDGPDLRPFSLRIDFFPLPPEGH
jgi:DNA-binding transcriptional ArsR family regulator